MAYYPCGIPMMATVQTMTPAPLVPTVPIQTMTPAATFVPVPCYQPQMVLTPQLQVGPPQVPVYTPAVPMPTPSMPVYSPSMPVYGSQQLLQCSTPQFQWCETRLQPCSLQQPQPCSTQQPQLCRSQQPEPCSQQQHQLYRAPTPDHGALSTPITGRQSPSPDHFYQNEEEDVYDISRQLLALEVEEERPSTAISRRLNEIMNRPSMTLDKISSQNNTGSRITHMVPSAPKLGHQKTNVRNNLSQNAKPSAKPKPSKTSLQPVKYEVTCSICYSDDKPLALLIPCGHSSMCGDCARRIQSGDARCPFCRKTFTDILEDEILKK